MHEFRDLSNAKSTKSTKSTKSKSSKGLKVPKLIPNISKSTYDLAHQCCLQLWSGVEFSSGRSQTSDAALLQTWAGKFQNHVQNQKQLRYSEKEINEMTHAAQVSRFLNFNASDRKSLNKAFNYSIKSLYFDAGIASDVFSQDLGRALTKNPNHSGKIIVASRFLFFALPDRCTFNLNQYVAMSLGMNKQADKFKSDLVAAFHHRIYKDWKILKKYQMPYRTPEIKADTWELACSGGWWQRRVLDVAVLLELKLTTAAYTRQLIRHKQKPKKC